MGSGNHMVDGAQEEWERQHRTMKCPRCESERIEDGVNEEGDEVNVCEDCGEEWK